MTPRPAAAIVAALAFALAGCAGGGDSDDAPADGEVEGPGVAGAGRVVFTCDDGFRFAARFREGAVGLVLPFGNADLTAQDAEGRYQEGARFLRVWGDHQARYETPDGGERRCSGIAAAGPREESRLLGYDYRAVGQEPGWILEIDRDRWIRFTTDYGATTVVVPVPALTDSAGATVLDARSDAHDLRVVLSPGPCSDTMSGEQFPDAVEVTLDGVVVRGCGEELEG